MKIPIIFGILHFHQKDQLGHCDFPKLACHFYTARWLGKWTNLHSKRIFAIY